MSKEVSADVEDVARASVRGPSLPRHAWLGPAQLGAELREKPEGPRTVPGITGKGKAGRGERQ